MLHTHQPVHFPYSEPIYGQKTHNIDLGVSNFCWSGLHVHGWRVFSISRGTLFSLQNQRLVVNHLDCVDSLKALKYLTSLLQAQIPAHSSQEYGPLTALLWARSNLPSGECIFSAQFSARWGGLYLPYVRSEGWRWLTSLVVHENILHVTINAVAFAALCSALERIFGFW